MHNGWELTLLLSRRSITMVFLFFSLFPFQGDEADVSEEVKAALVSGKPVRHVPFGSASLTCI